MRRAAHLGTGKELEMKCQVCFHGCDLEEGQTGLCRARTNIGGRIVCTSYGKVTALALDPVSKKPLAQFHPGMNVLSAGSFGCNLSCPFCQNHEISMADESFPAKQASPEELAALAKRLVPQRNIGIAFTYNEPLIGWEFVRDTAALIHKEGLLNILVTNGTASPQVLEQILPYVDAMNIDLKTFDETIYRRVLGGDLQMTLDFIRRSAAACHVELTTLIVPGISDSVEQMRREAAWIHDLEISLGKTIPLHVTRYFPAYRMEAEALPVRTIRQLAAAAREQLSAVYLGNC